MNTDPMATNQVSPKVVVLALRGLAAKTTAYLTLAIVSTLAMAAIAVFVPWWLVRARIYAFVSMVALGSIGLVQARRRLQVGRILRLARAGAHITMDGSELTATHNNVSYTMLVDVKTSYAINFPPANLKMPRATVVK